MKMLFHTIEGSLILDDDTELLGVVTGNVHVPEGVQLIMGGLVMGDLSVAAGGEADVNGVVMGYIINNGGRVKLSEEEGYAGRISVVPPHTRRSAEPRASFWGGLRHKSN